MEKLLQFVWQHRLGLRRDMMTVDGHTVRVLDQGTLNTMAGPDFFNASIEIDGQNWVGNVEIHVRASDWYRHGHQNDRAYDSVILHVVKISDMEVKRPDGQIIPQMVIKCDPTAADRCNRLTDSAASSLPCRCILAEMHPLYVTDWITSLAYQRLYRKSDRILDIVEQTHGDWAEATYRTLARTLGFGHSSQPFEQLAASLPLSYLLKHRDNQDACEAMFFGQAGLIPDPTIDEHPYITRLRQNYLFLANKFDLHCTHPIWKSGRPQNNPMRLIAYLAQMICYTDNLLDEMECARTLDDLRDVFDHPLLGFWANTFTFNSAPAPSSDGLKQRGNSVPARAIGRDGIDRIIINLAVPMLHARACWRGDSEAATAAVEILEKLKPEDNSITRLFSSAGINNRDAFTSQAMIELRREYCQRKKCIYCRFGHRMLSAEIQR